MSSIDDVLKILAITAKLPRESGIDLELTVENAKVAILADLLELVPEKGNNLHICKPKSHTIDPQTEGYKDYAHLPKEYANCVLCGAVPSKQRFETMSDAMLGWNAAHNYYQVQLKEYFK